MVESLTTNLLVFVVAAGLIGGGGVLLTRRAEEIAKITSRLAVNRTAFKTRGEEISGWIGRIREAVDAGQD